MSGVWKEHKTINDYIRGSTRMASIIDKIREKRSRWFGHVLMFFWCLRMKNRSKGNVCWRNEGKRKTQKEVENLIELYKGRGWEEHVENRAK